MNNKKIVNGQCDICCKENTKVYARVWMSYQKIWSGECIDCCINRKKYEERGKPHLGFKFNSSSTTWEVVDITDDPECVVCQSIEYPECGMAFEFYKIWEGINDGYFTIA